jgi:hypothetical protein
VADQDFRNDKVDAGEIGAGHEIVALYELYLQSAAADADAEAPLATVRLRYLDVDLDQVQELEQRVEPLARTFENCSARFRLSACVGEFAEILRQSIWARASSLGTLLARAEPLVGELASDPEVAEFVALVQQAARIPDLLPKQNELTQLFDAIKHNRHLHATLDQLQSQQTDESLRALQEQNAAIEQNIRELLEQRLRNR